jgi:DNA polymerase-3 subunit epsilon/ATP-dependent DNA helicase DinG
MPSYVALDIETTGLDPIHDSIIEIGAVRFNEKRIEAEWSTLVNPRVPISHFITHLTRITNSMEQNAPLIAQILHELIAFCGELPIVGHNISFDLAFINRAGALKSNRSIDTYELASVILPTATRYNLGSLAQQLGILQPATHRALDDARATHAVYNELITKAQQLPIEVVAEIVRLSHDLEWKAEIPFKQALASLSKAPIQPKRVLTGADEGPLFAAPESLHVAPLVPNDTLVPIDVDEAAACLESGGLFSKHFPDFEYRSQQVDMLRAVANAFSSSQHLMVEAGTGTGKSFAYLIPAAIWSMQNNARVVISTNTINLQDQLINKDIPDMCRALDLPLRAAVLKGRNNYLCPRRLAMMRKHGPENSDEMRVLAKILVWLLESSSGDRNEINLNGPIERMVWSRLSAEDENCKLETCLKRTGGRCPFYRARMAAESAHVLIVNHALLLADAAMSNRVLPAYSYLIVDEAHHLEAATTDAMSFKVRATDITRLIRELGSTENGTFGNVVTLVNDLLTPSDMAVLEKLIEQATDHAFRFDNQVTEYFSALSSFLEELREGKSIGTYAQQERILPATRKLPFWLDVEIAWEQANESLKSLMNDIKKIREPLGDLVANGIEDAEDLTGVLGTILMSFEEISNNLTALTLEPEENRIYWVELDPLRARITLQVAPLHIGTLMEKYLWFEKCSVILTSATLTTHGEFDYLRGRLNAQDADELMVGSPFDYENAALIYIASDVPEPSDSHGHQKAIENALVPLAKATGGRMLVLFTSYSQLQKTSQAIEGPLSKAEISVFEQGEGASASSLLENFKETERAVLLGTRAFWEGVDVPGEALSVLVIAKLPFDVPSDPIVAARSETFDDPFTEYSLPEAILRFRQGFGRLIRTQTDRGLVVILDKRILTKRYGRYFIDSLPTCSVVEGPIFNLPMHATKWLNL